MLKQIILYPIEYKSHKIPIVISIINSSIWKYFLLFLIIPFLKCLIYKLKRKLKFVKASDFAF